MQTRGRGDEISEIISKSLLQITKDCENDLVFPDESSEELLWAWQIVYKFEQKSHEMVPHNYQLVHIRICKIIKDIQPSSTVRWD